MTARQRIQRFGSMVVLIGAGLLAMAVAPGIVIEALGVFILLVGFLGMLMLVYLEVGFSEDRERSERRE